MEDMHCDSDYNNVILFTVINTSYTCQAVVETKMTVGMRLSPSPSPLLGGHQTAALPAWTFCGAQYLGKAATWCPQVVFCPQAHAGHSLEQCVGRLSHDRTTERHWQRLGSHRKYIPRSQHTRGSPRHVPQGSCCAIILNPFSSWSSTRLGRGTLAGPTPAPTVQ